MLTSLPTGVMNLLTYHALFRDLATRHKRILATPENGRFLRVLISSDFVQKQLDLQEFYNKLRDGLDARAGQPLLVVENYQTDYDDNQGDNLSRELRAAFLVLQLVQLDDYDARDQAIADCEQIAEQLLAAVVYRLATDYNTYATVGEAYSEHVGPVADGHVGVRVNLSWKQAATPALTYDPDNFN